MFFRRRKTCSEPSLLVSIPYHPWDCFCIYLQEVRIFIKSKVRINKLSYTVIPPKEYIYIYPPIFFEVSELYRYTPNIYIPHLEGYGDPQGIPHWSDHFQLPAPDLRPWSWLPGACGDRALLFGIPVGNTGGTVFGSGGGVGCYICCKFGDRMGFFFSNFGKFWWNKLDYIGSI